MKLVQIAVTKERRIEMSTYGFPGEIRCCSQQVYERFACEETFIKMKPTAFVPYVSTTEHIKNQE